MTVDEKLAVIARAVLELASRLAVSSASSGSDWPDEITTGVTTRYDELLREIAEGKK